VEAEKQERPEDEQFKSKDIPAAVLMKVSSILCMQIVYPLR